MKPVTEINVTNDNPSVEVRFWTNDLDDKPKHIHGSGIIYTVRNTKHGLKKTETKFNSLDELSYKIRQLLVDNGVTIHQTTINPQGRTSAKVKKVG